MMLAIFVLISYFISIILNIVLYRLITMKEQEIYDSDEKSAIKVFSFIPIISSVVVMIQVVCIINEIGSKYKHHIKKAVSILFGDKEEEEEEEED